GQRGASVTQTDWHACAHRLSWGSTRVRAIRGRRHHMRRPAASAAPGLLAILLAAVVAMAGVPSHAARAADRSAQLAVPPTTLAAHRALYSLTLDTGGNGTGSDVVGAGGRMGYEVLDACDGWATHQQLD